MNRRPLSSTFAMQASTCGSALILSPDLLPWSLLVEPLLFLNTEAFFGARPSCSESVSLRMTDLVRIFRFSNPQMSQYTAPSRTFSILIGQEQSSVDFTFLFLIMRGGMARCNFKRFKLPCLEFSKSTSCCVVGVRKLQTRRVLRPPRSPNRNCLGYLNCLQASLPQNILQVQGPLEKEITLIWHEQLGVAPTGLNLRSGTMSQFGCWRTPAESRRLLEKANNWERPLTRQHWLSGY